MKIFKQSSISSQFIATRSKQEAERPVLDFQGCKLTLLSSPGPQASLSSAGNCKPTSLAAPSLASHNPCTSTCPIVKLLGLKSRCYSCICSLIYMCVFLLESCLAFGHVTFEKDCTLAVFFPLDDGSLWECMFGFIFRGTGGTGL